MLVLHELHRSDEAVAQFRNCLNEERVFGGITQDFTQAFDDSVEAGVEVNKGVGGPKRGAELFAGNRLSRVLQEFQQDYEGLILNFDPNPALAQFVRAGVNLECAETVHRDLLLYVSSCGQARVYHNCPEDPATPRGIYR